jgi:SAM-dependent methyltransferase
MNKNFILCRVCGSNKYHLISSEVSGDPDSSVYQCQDCSLVYLYPIMTEEEEKAFYEQEFEKYMEGRSGPGWKSPQAHFMSYQHEGERRLPLVRPYLSSEDYLLEIGSSTGYFLDDLAGYVNAVVGVEPSKAYREFALNRGIHTVELLSDLEDTKFDVIAIYYVLEHLRDPVGYLTDLKSRLNPGGRILIEVPNAEDILVSRYDIPNFGPFYWQKVHYYIFSKDTLADVVNRAGLEMEVFPEQRYDLSNHMVWMMEGRPGGMGKYDSIFSDELEISYSGALKRHWVCDTIFAIITKKD